MICEVISASARFSFKVMELMSRTSSFSIVAILAAFLHYFEDLGRALGNYLWAVGARAEGVLAYRTGLLVAGVGFWELCKFCVIVFVICGPIMAMLAPKWRLF